MQQQSRDPRNEAEEERDDRMSSLVATAVPTALITVFIVCLFGGLWFALPLARHRASGGPRRQVRAGPGGPGSFWVRLLVSGGRARDVRYV